jgi:hypothetical protein
MELAKIYRGKPLGLVSFAGDFAAEIRPGRPVISLVSQWNITGSG